MDRRLSVEEEDTCPVDHACGGTIGCHDGVKELPVNGVVSLCYVQKEGGSGGVGVVENVWEELVEVDGGGDVPAGKEGRLFGADCILHGDGEPGSKDSGEKTV